MGIDQPKVSRLLRGHFGGFSTQRLIDFLTALGRDVDIVVRSAPRSRKRGRLSIAAA
jgi:predicted XRE-type DNA-binding protein